METEYNARDAREILEPCGVLGEYLLLDDRGVWPAVERDMTMQHETELLRWQPADELMDLPGAPCAIDTPMLPVPFTARQLAAFMLYGMGAQVADFYGDWEDGPDRDSLNHFDPKSHARRAVVDAFAAYRLALGVVGDMDANAQTRLDAASEAYRADHTNKLRAGERSKAHADFDAVHLTWVAKMVRCLLLPESAPATEVARVAPESETPEERRARWLDWYGKGERGAVQRVYERELLQNHKADRSYIGKQIKLAKTERADKKRGGAMFGQLVQDGKRVG